MRIESLALSLFLPAVAACHTPFPEPNSPQTPPRIVAFGDVHGDLDAARRALRLAGAIDATDHWIGGELVVVQTGDLLDRGNDEWAILEWFARLAEEAEAAGGAFHQLLGNHELMNVAGDLRYVTPDGFPQFEGVATFDPDDPEFAELEPHQRARAAAFRPGSPYALRYAEQEVILLLDGNVFVHGGVLPSHLDYGLERIRDELRGWLRGERERPSILSGVLSPIWTRAYSSHPDEGAAAQVEEVLARLGAERMIVGHTVQEGGITPAFEGRVWCVDTGMSRHYGGSVEVLVIEGDEVTVRRESSPIREEDPHLDARPRPQETAGAGR